GEVRFRVPKADLQCWVEKEGFETVPTTVKPEPPLVVRLKRQGTIRGRVVEAGTLLPVPGVPVHGWNWYSFAMKSPLAVSDTEGRCTARAGPGKGMRYARVAGWAWP